MVRSDRPRGGRRFSGALGRDEPHETRAQWRCNRCDPFYRFLPSAAAVIRGANEIRPSRQRLIPELHTGQRCSLPSYPPFARGGGCAGPERLPTPPSRRGAGGSAQWLSTRQAACGPLEHRLKSLGDFQ